jgi:putative transposase
MKKSGFTEQQIAYSLRQAESGVPIEEITLKMGVTQATFYRWKKKFAGMGVAEVRRLKQLVADISLDKAMLQDVLSKKV